MNPYSPIKLCRRCAVVFFVAFSAFMATSVAWAQPLSAVLILNGSNQYVEVPSSPALTPSGGMTIEFLSASQNNGDYSFVGKDYLTSYWIGNNNGVLSSWINGQPCVKGTISSAESIHHIAVTYDTAFVRHYIDGELVGVCAGNGPIVANNSPLRFGSDVSWEYTPTGFLDEIRLWSTVRTQQEIQQNMSVEITSPQPGLVAVWSFDLNADDIINGHNGTLVGGATDYYYYHPGGSCPGGANVACFNSGQFGVLTEYQLYSTPASDGSIEITSTGIGTLVPGASDTSALFWYFSASDWELLAKAVQGCALTNTWWNFAAATTNVHHRVVWFDFARGEQRIYWSFAGPPAPALTDTSGFSCAPPS